MQLRNMLAAAIGVQIILFGMTWNVWAGSAGGAVSCLVGKHGPGAVKLRGTVAVDVTSNVGSVGGEQDVDFVVRLERSGLTKFFRLHLMTPALTGLTHEEIACRIFNPDDTSDTDTISAVTAFVQQILTDFGLTGKTVLVITDKSVSDSESLAGTVFGPAPHQGSMADITVYAQ